MSTSASARLSAVLFPEPRLGLSLVLEALENAPRILTHGAFRFVPRVVKTPVFLPTATPRSTSSHRPSAAWAGAQALIALRLVGLFLLGLSVGTSAGATLYRKQHLLALFLEAAPLLAKHLEEEIAILEDQSTSGSISACYGASSRSSLLGLLLLQQKFLVRALEAVVGGGVYIVGGCHTYQIAVHHGLITNPGQLHPVEISLSEPAKIRVEIVLQPGTQPCPLDAVALGRHGGGSTTVEAPTVGVG
jgi:hypothetical protein